MHARCLRKLRGGRHVDGWGLRPVVGDVEGVEAGVSLGEHSVDGVSAVDAAPPTTGLPHVVQRPADHQG